MGSRKRKAPAKAKATTSKPQKSGRLSPDLDVIMGAVSSMNEVARKKEPRQKQTERQKTTPPHRRQSLRLKGNVRTTKTDPLPKAEPKPRVSIKKSSARKTATAKPPPPTASPSHTWTYASFGVKCGDLSSVEVRSSIKRKLWTWLSSVIRKLIFFKEELEETEDNSSDDPATLQTARFSVAEFVYRGKKLVFDPCAFVEITTGPTRRTTFTFRILNDEVADRLDISRDTLYKACRRAFGVVLIPSKIEDAKKRDSAEKELTVDINRIKVEVDEEVLDLTENSDECEFLFMNLLKTEESSTDTSEEEDDMSEDATPPANNNNYQMALVPYVPQDDDNSGSEGNDIDNEQPNQDRFQEIFPDENEEDFDISDDDDELLSIVGDYDAGDYQLAVSNNDQERFFGEISSDEYDDDDDLPPPLYRMDIDVLPTVEQEMAPELDRID